MSVYLDNAASTKTDPRVSEAMIPYLGGKYGNPSSFHLYGKPLKVLIEDAREEIASFIGCKPKEVFFTSGGTEANNFAIKGYAFANYGNRRNHIITSTVEHPAVIETVIYLKKFGYKVTALKPEKNGTVPADKIVSYIDDSALLVSVMHANNELGCINDVYGIGKLCSEKGIAFHSDTVQSIGKTALNVKESGITFASVSAHKIYGPKGTGILFADENFKLDKYIHGGGQERNMRGGTENAAGIAGLKETIRILKSEMESDIIHYSGLKSYLVKNLNAVFGDSISFNSPESGGLDNIVSVTFNPGKLNVSEGMIPIQLDLKGIMVSGGSACSSGSLKPSAVLKEIGLNERTALSSIRISFGRFNNEKDIDALIEALREIL